MASGKLMCRDPSFLICTEEAKPLASDRFYEEQRARYTEKQAMLRETRGSSPLPALPPFHTQLPLPFRPVGGAFFLGTCIRRLKLGKVITERRTEKVHQDVLNTPSLLW